MKQYEQRLSVREKRAIFVSTAAFALIGAALGVIAYYGKWLG